MGEIMKLAERLKDGDTIFTAWSSLAATPVVDLLARSGFDAVTLDMQHGAHRESSIFDGLGAVASCRKGSIVRIPVGRNDMASRALDFGAEAVIAPMINSRRDAEQFASAMKYPPIGERSWGPQRALQLHGFADMKDYLASANRNTLAFAMIETRAALAAAEDIIDVDGIDGLFVGPSDFSISWTNGNTVDPHIEEMEAAVADIARIARARGKHAGIFVFDPPRSARFVEMGFRLLAVTNDVAFLGVGAAAGLAAAKGGSSRPAASSY
jgi:4-hydroxy-2-oxoheptanedioate aldolase